VIPVVVLFAVRKQLAAPDNVLKLAHGLLRLLAPASVQVAIEHAAGRSVCCIQCSSDTYG
jgi:hypothetical protein